MNTNIRKYSIVASILMHIFIFSLWVGAVKLDLFTGAIEKEKVVNDEPIVFDLLQQQRPREVIETPEDAKVVENQKDADFLSDKNALARNSETDPNVDLGDAFAKGEFEFRELPTNRGPRGQPGQPSELQAKNDQASKQQEDDKTESQDYYVENTASEFNRDYLIKAQTTSNPGVEESLPRVKYDNQDSRAPDMGGLSFNTYAWDFAPYLLALKRKVERNIFPPPAFTRLGLISGETLLRFKIYPNGEMKDLEILDSQGHKTLLETSYRAIEISAPFPNLPSHFPEEYLEVTARFSYFIHK